MPNRAVELIKGRIENEDYSEIHVFLINPKQGSTVTLKFKSIGGWCANAFNWTAQVVVHVASTLSSFVFVLFALLIVFCFVFRWNLFSRRKVRGSDEMRVPAHICVISFCIWVLAFAADKILTTPPSAGQSYDPSDELTNVDSLKKFLDAREKNLFYRKKVCRTS